VRRSQFVVILIVIVLFASIAAVWIARPTLAPTYLGYDLIGRRIAPLPPDVEQFVIQSGDEYCAQGHDSDCGGYKIVAGRALATHPPAWCVDYVMLRRNLGRTGDLFYWAKIPKAMVVTRAGDGGYQAMQVDDCQSAGPG
jgi:hypothetical protein